MDPDRSPIYSSLAGDEEIGEIIALYAGEMPDRAAQLQACLDAGNWEELRETTHRIKGSAGSHGFNSVSVVADELNNLIKIRGPVDRIAELARTLIDMCLRVTGEKAPDSTSAPGKRT